LVSPAQFEVLANLEIDLGLVRPPIPALQRLVEWLRANPHLDA